MRWADTVSDAVPDHEGSDNDDMQTNATSVRTSKTKLSCQRSRGVRARKLAEVKAHHLANGLPWVDKDDTTIHPQAAPSVFVDGREVQDEVVSRLMATQVLELSKKFRFTKEELMDMYHSMDDFFRPRWVAEPDRMVYQETEASLLEVREHGWQWCRICSRWADDAHRGSDGHKLRVNEQAAANAMAGPCSSMRRFEKTPGLLEPCTKDGMNRYWGGGIGEMPRILWDKLRDGTTFEFAIPGWGRSKKQLRYRDILSIDLAVVTYGGTGKYIMDVDFAVDWQKLPDALRPEDRLQDHCRATRGWWPIAWVQWSSECVDVQFRGTETEYRQLQLSDAICIWCVCWYQLFAGWYLTLWPVYFNSRL
jgi:hypothetical protein